MPEVIDLARERCRRRGADDDMSEAESRLYKLSLAAANDATRMQNEAARLIEAAHSLTAKAAHLRSASQAAAQRSAALYRQARGIAAKREGRK